MFLNSSKLLTCVLVLTSISLSPTIAKSSGISKLLETGVPVPSLRPDTTITNSIRPAKSVPIQVVQSPVSSQKKLRISATRGNLKQGLKAVSDKNASLALSIREGMRKGSLDRKILTWTIALSGMKGVPSSEVSRAAAELQGWPGKTAMRRNSEAALVRENLSASSVIKAYSNASPLSLTGAEHLAQSYLATGNRKSARKVIAPHWHGTRLSKKSEDRILKKLGSVLTVNDHRRRMNYLFYRDRVKDANRHVSRAQQASLAKARTAVSKRSGKAGQRLKNVSPKWRKDPAYQYSRIQYLRRAGKIRQAGRLMASTTRDAYKLIHPDEWWVERRVLSRELLDIGEYKLAYKIAAEHSAKSKTKRAEAEFHAGWYALRFLKNKSVARKHFANILNISNTPISQARGYYWLGRAHSGSKATSYYQKAAVHQGTYYGQLARVKLGKRSLSVGYSKPSASDRANYRKRELVKAISRLESNGYGWRAEVLYRHLARTLTSPGEISLLTAQAEKLGKRKLALQLGKLAYRRGLPVISASWPIGAIPGNIKVGSSGKAIAYAIARQESAFDHKAVSSANARGLLQLLPGTAKLMARKTGIKYSYKKLTRDPSYNARLGSAYLNEQLTKFNGSYILTFAGYNAGPGRSVQWIKKYGDPRTMKLDKVVDWVERIPFTETRNYVQRVMENTQIYNARLNRSRLSIDKDLMRGRP